jgi:hypothetical protein
MRSSAGLHCRAAASGIRPSSLLGRTSRDGSLDLDELSPAERDRYLARAGFEPIGLHECRHTYASLMIAAMSEAGTFDAKKLSVYMGHSSSGITIDRYGHLFPGNEDESAAMLDAFLERSDTAARLAQVES